MVVAVGRIERNLHGLVHLDMQIDTPASRGGMEHAGRHLGKTGIDS